MTLDVALALGAAIGVGLLAALAWLWHRGQP